MALELMRRLLLVSPWLLLAACGPESFEVVVAVDDLSIDDLEDGDFLIPERGGRQGLWYCFNDVLDGQPGDTARLCDVPENAAPEAIELPSPQTLQVTSSGRGGGGSAILSTGEPFRGWGAGVGVSLVPQPRGYPVTNVAGFRFWARGGSEGASAVRVQFPSNQTREDRDCRGAECDPFYADCQLTADWQQYSVYFEVGATGIGCEAFGSPFFEEFDGAAITDIQYLFRTPEQGFELWLDDLELIPFAESE